MTPAQKLRMGKAIAEDIGKRYKSIQLRKAEAKLSEILNSDEILLPQEEEFSYFLSWSNSLFNRFNKIDVLKLLVEKSGIDAVQHQTYLRHQSELIQHEGIFYSKINANFRQTIDDMEPEDATRYEQQVNLLIRGQRKKEQMVFDFLHFNERRGTLSPQQIQTLKELESLDSKRANLMGKMEELEIVFLKSIEEKWRSGKLKHALLNHTPKVKKRKTTLARAVPRNQLYPEKRKEKLEEMKYTGKDIRGLETFTVKQFQALHFLAHKAQNQTEEEKEALEIYKELGGFEDGKFRTIAYKESEYITNTQGKDHALVSTRERDACVAAIKEIEDVEFSVLWEKKGKKKKDTLQVVAHHEMFKKLTLKQPWSIIRETPKGKKIKNFHFIAIPERVFEYQEIKGGSKYDGVKVLFDVINLDPDFFSTLKYADPEIQHVSEALMRLSLLFIFEGSFGRKEFVIDEEKLLKRLGLIEPKGRNKERGVKTLDMYIEKLLAHETLTNAEKRGKQRVFNLPKKKKK